MYPRKGVTLSNQTQIEDWQPKFNEMKGRIHANLLELDSVSFYFDEALKGYTKIGNKKGQATTFFKIGWIHKKRGELEKAM